MTGCARYYADVTVPVITGHRAAVAKTLGACNIPIE